MPDDNTLNSETEDKLAELLSQTYSQEWSDNVSEAIELVLNTLPEDQLSEEIIHEIVDYNVQKTFDDKILGQVLSVLPKSLTWNDMEQYPFNVLRDLEGFTCACDLSPGFIQHDMPITVTHMELAQDAIAFWKKIMVTEFPHLKMTSRRRGDVLTLTLKHVS